MGSLIDRYEEATGLTYDPLGPDPVACPYCDGLLQFVTEHSCHGLESEARECAFGGHGVIDE